MFSFFLFFKIGPTLQNPPPTQPAGAASNPKNYARSSLSFLSSLFFFHPFSLSFIFSLLSFLFVILLFLISDSNQKNRINCGRTGREIRGCWIYEFCSWETSYSIRKCAGFFFFFFAFFSFLFFSFLFLSSYLFVITLLIAGGAMELWITSSPLQHHKVVQKKVFSSFSFPLFFFLFFFLFLSFVLNQFLKKGPPSGGGSATMAGGQRTTGAMGILDYIQSGFSLSLLSLSSLSLSPLFPFFFLLPLLFLLLPQDFSSAKTRPVHF